MERVAVGGGMFGDCRLALTPIPSFPLEEGGGSSRGAQWLSYGGLVLTHASFREEGRSTRSEPHADPCGGARGRSQLHAVDVLVDGELHQREELNLRRHQHAQARADEEKLAAAVFRLGLLAAITSFPQRVELQQQR